MDRNTINSWFIESVSYLINNKTSRNRVKIVRSLGIGAARLSETLNNRVKAGTDPIACLCFKYGISSDQVLMGKGPMFRGNRISEGPKQARIPGTIPTLSSEDFISIPLAEISVATGRGGYDNPSYLDVIDVIEMPSAMLKDSGQYFCIRVKSGSMTPITLGSSYIIARTLDRSEWGHMPDRRVYIISDRDGRAYLERIKNRLSNSGFIVCIPGNVGKLNYPNFNLEEQEINCIFRVEWALNARMSNLNETYYDRVNQLEDKYGILES